jgi:hypothetical protein
MVEMGERVLSESVLTSLANDFSAQIKQTKPKKVFIYCDELDEIEREYFARQIRDRIGNGIEISALPGRWNPSDRGDYSIDLKPFIDMFNNK